MNLQQITTLITGMANRRDFAANTTQQAAALDFAQKWINRELRCPANEKWINYTVPSTFTGLTIPPDFLELIGIFPNADWHRRLRKDKLEKVQNYAEFADGRPELYARQGNAWIVGPTPTDGEVLTLGYYAEVPAMVNSTDTNIISIIAWELYVYGSLVFFGELYNDKRTPVWEARFNKIIEDMNDVAGDDELDEGHMEFCHSYPDDDTDNFEIWVP